MIQLIKVCGLPVERYFNPAIMREESEQRQRVSHKLKPVSYTHLDVYKRQLQDFLPFFFLGVGCNFFVHVRHLFSLEILID